MFYKISGMPLTSLKELAIDDDVIAFVKDGYDHGNEIELYTKHSGYDVLEMINDELNEDAKVHKSSFDSDSSDDDNEQADVLDDLTDLVDSQTEGDDNLDIPKITTDDPWLNKLVGKGNFIGYTENPKPLDERFILEEDDPDEHLVDQKFKVHKNGVSYPSFDQNTPWDKCTPVLGMKFDSPFQLKNCLANYGVKNGYQLWYMQNDSSKLLVKCGRDVSKGKCAGMKGKKPKPKPSVEEPKVGETSREGEKEVCSEKLIKESLVTKQKIVRVVKKIKERWSKKKIKESKRLRGQVDCPFRLWASWMSTERSFQIKTLYPEHKCCRNYSLGSLVTYRWIAKQYPKDIIHNPWISHRSMQELIRENFLISVSLGQCKRANILALFDHEDGLVKHYSRLWEYRQALMESNLNSTCQLDMYEDDHGDQIFKRIYVYFSGLRQGWLDGCRRVIAWAVVSVENKNNWCWFLSLLHDDLSLGKGSGLTIISDAHKGLIEAVASWFPNAEHRQCTRHIYANFKRKWSTGRMWELSGISCVHAVAAYMHMKMEPELGLTSPNHYLLLKEKRQGDLGRTETPVPKPTSTTPAVRTGPPSSPPIMPPKGPPGPRSNVMGKGKCQLQLTNSATVSNTVGKNKGKAIISKNQGKASAAMKKRTGVGIGSPIRMRSTTTTRQSEQMEMDYEDLADVDYFSESDENERYNTPPAGFINDFNLFDEVPLVTPSNPTPSNSTPSNPTPSNPIPTNPTFANPTSANPAPANQAPRIRSKRNQLANHVVPRVFFKQRGRSERIAKMQCKNFKVDEKGTSFTHDKAFPVFESESG
ncbi:calcium/proton exchanger [Tanacetum coccineum]